MIPSRHIKTATLALLGLFSAAVIWFTTKISILPAISQIAESVFLAPIALLMIIIAIAAMMIGEGRPARVATMLGIAMVLTATVTTLAIATLGWW